ncbi:putative nad-dependent epimerase dehydratase protein [Eutypa lata UCREL1]|uniref:Putative nad-dependent epimerase dehydratase protein n=1 Tax=Eutypa lata (strain UCR-EL1) TaxID=1287681 RepID=M7TF81_EUTLA|nr:putative nad-dependent epimerase dehydratase protein [Eutypa lata UCREL1]
MQILILGGSGRTGQLIISEALARGHGVTALVRNPSSFSCPDPSVPVSAASTTKKGTATAVPTISSHPNLTLVRGTPLSAPDMDGAFIAAPTPTEAVVVALNARRVSDSPFSAPSPDTPPRMMADSVANARAAMRRHRDGNGNWRCRLVVMSSSGAGSSFAGLNCLMKGVFTHTNMHLQLDDHNAVEAETRADFEGEGEKGPGFVFVRPAMLADGPAAPVKAYPDDGKGAGFLPKITRASVANFIVDAVEESEFVGRSPVITN